jgi:hypothetical protein
MTGVRLLGLAVLIALFTGACSHGRPQNVGPGPRPPEAKDLPPPDAISGTFTVRQKLTARSAHGGGSFEAVLQKRPGELLLVGLTPYGSRAFVLRQTAGDVQFTSYLPRDLPFPPAYMLLDIHRVLDAWPGPGPAAGERAMVVAGERIVERWRDGRLVERTFTRVAPVPPGERPGEIEISYQGVGPAGLAAVVELENRRFGYSLTIESVSLR